MKNLKKKYADLNYEYERKAKSIKSWKIYNLCMLPRKSMQEILIFIKPNGRQ